MSNTQDKTTRKDIRNRRASKDLDSEFLESYRNVLFGQYRSLNNPIEDAKAKQEAEGILQMEKEGRELDWEDLYRLEMAIIKLEPWNLLCRHAWILRQEYEEVASNEEKKCYYASNPPEPPDSDKPDQVELLRADCIRLQEELTWHYIVIWVVEEFRNKLSSQVLKSTGKFLLIVLLVLLFVFLLPLRVPPVLDFFNYLNLPFLALIIVPGVIGGSISTIRRIQTVRLDGNVDLTLTQLDQTGSVILSPFLGGVFALLLFCLFTGGFLSGNFFPKFEFHNLWEYSDQELACKEIAKLVIWSFIAGFSERFVPDRLDQIAKTVDQSPAVSK